MSLSGPVSVYQIFYDERTRALLEPGYIPLDNTTNPRPDWFEFWPIRQFLRSTQLEAERWYGFLSPRFGDKSKLSASEVFEFIATIDGFADVALFSSYWDQIAYFQNSFEQGDYYHPGLMGIAKRFLAAAEITVDLDRLVSDTQSTVFSNYIVAKPIFWSVWLDLADRLFEFAESSSDPAAIAMREGTAYKGNADGASMKVFIQERLASIVLSDGRFRTASIDTSDRRRPPGLLPPRILRSLQTCDLLKQEYRRTGDRTFLDAYRKLRATIPMRQAPLPAPGPALPLAVE